MTDNQTITSFQRPLPDGQVLTVQLVQGDGGYDIVQSTGPAETVSAPDGSNDSDCVRETLISQYCKCSTGELMKVTTVMIVCGGRVVQTNITEEVVGTCDCGNPPG